MYFFRTRSLEGTRLLLVVVNQIGLKYLKVKTFIVLCKIEVKLKRPTR